MKITEDRLDWIEKNTLWQSIIWLPYRLWYKFTALYRCKVIYPLQVLFRGYSNREQWDFGYAAIEWMLPRIKAYRASKRHGVPSKKDKKQTWFTEEEWNEVLDKIIWSMENIDTDPGFFIDAKYQKKVAVAHQKKLDEGFQLLGKYLTSMWD